LYHCVIVSFYHLAQGAVALALFVRALVACMAAYADADAVALARAAQGAVALALFMRALVACMAAYADADAVALARAAAVARLRELFEQQHALLERAKLAVNSRCEWLNE
jgi:hypothetical protein